MKAVRSVTAKPPEQLDKQLRQFAAHLRNPREEPAPADLEDRRLAIYRRLFFNNIRSLLGGNFPVLRDIHSEQDWTLLCRDFFVHHRARTPLFPELPREFLRFLQDVRGQREGDPPFMLELAHYEWVELALAIETTELSEIECNPKGDLLDQPPVVSPLAWPLAYRYPVHRIKPDFQPQEPPDEPTHLLVYRNRDDRVRFMQLNAVSSRLLELLQSDEGLTGAQAIRQVGEEMQYPDQNRLAAAGAKLLADLASRDVILGTTIETTQNTGSNGLNGSNHQGE